MYFLEGNLSDKVISLKYSNPRTVNLSALGTSNIHFCLTWEFAPAVEPVRQEHDCSLGSQQN